jgi:hypothetical protein
MSETPIGAENGTAFCEGMDARNDDDSDGNLTDCPYTPGTIASACWYRGYNLDEESPEIILEIRGILFPTVPLNTNHPHPCP